MVPPSRPSASLDSCWLRFLGELARHHLTAGAPLLCPHLRASSSRALTRVHFLWYHIKVPGIFTVHYLQVNFIFQFQSSVSIFSFNLQVQVQSSVTALERPGIFLCFHFQSVGLETVGVEICGLVWQALDPPSAARFSTTSRSFQLTAFEVDELRAQHLAAEQEHLFLYELVAGRYPYSFARRYLDDFYYYFRDFDYLQDYE